MVRVMADCMIFPDTVEEFMEQYKIVDTEHVYTNGTEFVPIYRMKQWFEHLPPAQCNCKKMNTVYELDGTVYTQDKDKQGWTGHLLSAQSKDWIERNKERILQAGKEGREIEFRIGGRLFAIREKAQ